MQCILSLTKTNKLILASFAFLAVLALGGGRANAATLNVSGGCTLPIAINSVNAGSNQSGCTAVVSPDAYGASDIISIPAGVQTITADLPVLTKPAKIQGAGMSQTTISGNNGQYVTIEASTADVEVSDLKITAFNGAALSLVDCDVVLKNIEVDGQGSIGNGGALFGIYISSSLGTTKTVDSNNVFIHNFNVSESNGINMFTVQQRDGGTTTSTLQNTTISDIHNTGGSLNGFTMGIGMFNGALGSTGTINSTITNATIDDITSNKISGPFSSVTFANGGNATITTNVYNATITRTRGVTGSAPPTTGVLSGAFYAVSGGILTGNNATTTVNVGDSLIANNLTDGTTSNNCSKLDLSTGIGGQGSGTSVINSLGHNISDDASCTGFNHSGDQQNVNNIISTLGSLQDNGGLVPTRALLTGSPAISAGGAVLGVSTDARGIARPATCPSVGAYQYVGAVCGVATTVASGASAGAPNTGTKAVANILSISASALGLGMLAYVFRKRQHLN